ncbi:hypothetical protein G4B88_025031 [Cannabis sativa]|uniref:1,3-beta-glucan synthase n=1 Tax=Cannabis sativa TaxID=3483 RepID=A0A7J6DQ97_CANSA|nr:hypothetical protein G4B88_025031 [Cannabis sativa]
MTHYVPPTRHRVGGGARDSYAPPPPPVPPSMREVYNIIPIHDLLLMDHPSMRYPEVRAAAAALKSTGGLPLHPYAAYDPNHDLMDWLGLFFGFQKDSVRNQREHLVLHLANSQMRLQPPPAVPDQLEQSVLRKYRKKLLQNYSSWCSYVGRKSNVSIGSRGGSGDCSRELLYVALYLLVWGEAGNLRFAPECICYIYHHMAMELNRVLSGKPDPNTGQLFLPSFSGDCAFLKSVIMPIYKTISDEVESSRNGKAPHSAWRNYDDVNEYFWSRRCFNKLKWPIDLGSNFFSTTPKSRRVGKTGFVEQRSFWNLFRSFDRLWILLILFFQAAVIVAWDGETFPWQGLERRDVQVELLTVFITWGALRLLQSVLDAGTQYSLVSRETKWLGLRMVLKSLVALAWTVVFSVLYARIWSQKNSDRRWSNGADQRIFTFLEAVLVFLAPELLALVLFIVPWVRNFVEELNWRVVSWLTWWFYTRIFVGRGLREGLFDNIKYTVFWVLVLASKFSFSYFLQIKPLISPTKALLNLDGKYRWHEFFSSTNEIAVVLLWLPVILIYMMDLQIWYAIFSSIYGAAIGLFSHLGEIRNIGQLRLRFQFFASAMQFNLMPEEQLLTSDMSLLKKARDSIHRLKLRYGLGQAFKKIESSQVETTRFALIWNEIVIAFREEDLISDYELELLELPRIATELADETDLSLWLKICKSEYRRCAVIEAYDTVKHFLFVIVKYGTEEYLIVERFFNEIDSCIQRGKFTVEYKMSLLQKIHGKLISLIELLLNPKRDIEKAVNLLQALYELSVRELPKAKKSMEQLRREGLASINPANQTELLFEKAVVFPPGEDALFYRQLRRLHTILTSRDYIHNVPKNIEARRRIAFFSNSLFMNMPRAPIVEKMMAFSVLTPYYDEDVIFKLDGLLKDNEDGISTLFYLQKIYEDEWTNFMERMRREGLEHDEQIWEEKGRDLRLWASYRGQTLSRTVRGMMYYYRALQMLAFLDNASEMDIREGSQQIASHGSAKRNRGFEGMQPVKQPTSRNLGRAGSGVGLLFKGHEYGCALMKFTYVVACQLYGQHKAKGDPRAEDILYLMKNNEALRIAYVDEFNFGREDAEYYSVLVKYDQQLGREVEIYRIRLPGPLKLGEGKPENQNHAIIFTRGDALQTIDMNQDNYFEEALKMRNLLEEFKVSYGLRKPTILGVRENIFTGSVSSLAWFMSAQETSFVTLGQRVLANPLKVRMHYGHPDVFDRFWFFASGWDQQSFKRKGRDVGLNQISMFEAKVASGNGEQVLSRDVYRLGHRLDFFRMLSFYYSTVGYYFNTMMVILTVYTFLWGRLYLALSGVEDVASKNTSNNEALGAILNQQFVIQLGIFTALPMIVENSLEHGFLPAIWDFLTMQFQLASLFYTFSMGTRTHFFGRTILHGVLSTEQLDVDSWCNTRALLRTIDSMLEAILSRQSNSGVVDNVAFCVNPSGFDWLKTVEDFEIFMNWLWFTGGCLQLLIIAGKGGDLRFFFFQYGVVYQLGISGGNTSIAVYLLSWIYMVVAVGIYMIIAYARDKYAVRDHMYYRLVQLLVILVLVLVVVLLLEFTPFKFIDIVTSLLAFVPTGWGIILIAQVLRPFLQSTVVWETVVSVARMYDLLFGVIVMMPMALLSWLPGFQAMQTRILFNEAFSRGLQISRILTGKKTN